MKILIATLNYNANDLMNNLWASLRHNLKGDNWHFFVRDNSDKSPWDAPPDPRLTIKRYKNEGNYASMYNDLMREGVLDGYDVFVQLNNDTLALNDFLVPMEAIIKNQEVGAVGAKLFFPNGQLQHAGIIIHDNLEPLNVNYAVIEQLGVFENIPNHNREFPAVTGACLMMRVSDYKALGGMDEKFQWCYDDVDLCLRIGRDLNKKCVLAAGAHLIHIENYSTLKNPTSLKPSYRTALPYLRQKFDGYMRPDIFLYRMDYGRFD